MRRRMTRRTAPPILAAFALAATTTPVAAQDAAVPSFTPEDDAKAALFSEFVANRDEWLPTVNLIDPESLPVTFPFEDKLEHIAVDVTIGDSEPFAFMFDTGASTFVTQEIADEFGGETLVETFNRAGGDAFFWSPLKRYPPMTIGGAVTITEATSQVPWAAGGQFDCFAPDGLFGATSMRNAVWQIDYGAEEMTVAASVDQLDHIEDAVAVPFEISGGLSPTPHVQLGIGDSSVEFVVDTGGGVPLTIDPSVIPDLGLEIPADAPVNNGLAFGAAGPFPLPASFVRVPITFGGTEIEVPAMVASGLAVGTGGNIGHGFLRNFVVTFDWSEQMMYLDPLTEDGTIPVPPDPAGAGVAWTADGLVVGNIAAGSAADQAGLTVGEVVTHIGGDSVEGITIEQYCADIAGQTHETITTESGTYDVSPVAGFYDSLNE